MSDLPQNWKTSDVTLAEWRNGYQAYFDEPLGKTPPDNPYPVGTPAWQEWHDGNLAAAVADAPHPDDTKPMKP